MTREEIVEQVYLAVSGSKPVQDVNIERVDIDNYFDAVLPSVIEQEFKIRYNMARQMGEGEYFIDPEFTKEIEITVLEDDDCNKYADIMKIQSLPGSHGVRHVFTKDYKTQIRRVKTPAASRGLDDLPVSVFWLAAGGADRLHFVGVNAGTQLVAEVVPHAESYNDADEVIAPGIVIEETIKRMTEYFMFGKQLPGDEVVDLVENR